MNKIEKKENFGYVEVFMKFFRFNILYVNQGQKLRLKIISWSLRSLRLTLRSLRLNLS